MSLAFATKLLAVLNMVPNFFASPLRTPPTKLPAPPMVSPAQLVAKFTASFKPAVTLVNTLFAAPVNPPMASASAPLPAMLGILFHASVIASVNPAPPIAVSVLPRSLNHSWPPRSFILLTKVLSVGLSTSPVIASVTSTGTPARLLRGLSPNTSGRAPLVMKLPAAPSMLPVRLPLQAIIYPH